MMILPLMENAVCKYSSKVFKWTHSWRNFDILVSSQIFPEAYVSL